MYSYVRATGILKESDGALRHIDLTAIPLIRLYADYLNVEIVVIEASQPATELQIDLEALPSGLRWVQMTFTEWLVANGNNTLPTTPIMAVDNVRYARFVNLWQYDFSAELGSAGHHPDAPLSDEEKQDIRLGRLGADHQRLARNGLVSVNGFLHRSDYNEHGLYVLKGGATRQQSEHYQLGYLDLSPVGPFTTIPITPDMVLPRTEGGALKDSVLLNVKQSLSGKTAFLVIGGWLHALDDYYHVVGDTTIVFDFHNYPWFKRYWQTKDYLDLKVLGNLQLIHGAYDRDRLYSDDIIRRWFTLPQSFIVLLDNQDITVGTVALEDPKLTGRYYSRIKPELPLIVGDGRLTEYKATNEHVGWVVNPAIYLEDQLAIEETTYLEHPGIAYRRRSDAPVKIASTKWLRIGRVVETTA